MAKKGKQKPKIDPATKKFMEAKNIIHMHPMFEPMMHYVRIYRSEEEPFPKNGYAIVTFCGCIYVHPRRHESVEVWVYVLAHCLLHLGFEHFKKKQRWDLWNIACDVYVAKFLDDFKLGRNPNTDAHIIRNLHINTEEQLYEDLLEHGVDKKLLGFGIGNPGEPDMIKQFKQQQYHQSWRKLFGMGLRNAVSNAVNVASGKQSNLGSYKCNNYHVEQARNWLISSYPMLGSLVASFEIIVDQELCRQMGISVAAVHAEMQKIYINPALELTEEEYKFVIAHELLHVGLRHDARRQGRDPFLWNLACDYVINGWLVEMELGEMPDFGTLYDPTFKGESAESLYDIITTDLRRMRKFATYRGIGGCDMLDLQISDWWAHGDGVDLDRFYRGCLMQGLEYHYDQGRGHLPAGLVEEVRALPHPPIPWDVELAKWFDGHFAPLEKIRSYAKPSRRQFVSPDIPRPQYVPLWEAEENRTFGIVLDTSGSMDHHVLGRVLGAIASYSLSRDVSRIRLVFCDAGTYDQGYIAPEDLLERVKIKGRGGIVLQPGINLLEKAEDFPKDGPILIITDGGCDKLSIKREHAFFVPSYGRLPFAPKGKLFRVQ
ncbi:MAG: DUF2201 family putative metallopeptidase [Candidatus Comchoanobacterales bacterium]